MEYVEIKTQEDFETLLKNTHYCEDALIKEVALINDSYVDDKYQMHSYGASFFNVKILIQTQWKDVPAVELLCLGVETIALECRCELGVYGNVESGKIRLFFDESRSETNSIVAKGVKYRTFGADHLGHTAFFHHWEKDGA